MIIDQFTKLLACFPIANQTAVVVSKVLVDNVFSRLGCPIELHPSSNGQVERYNRTILQTIRCFLKGKQQDWELWLQQLVGAIRATPNIQPGFSPNMMMFGREAFQALDVTIDTLKIDLPKNEVLQYILNLVNNLGNIHETARGNLKAKQERQKDMYDLKNYPNLYPVGDVAYKTKSMYKGWTVSKAATTL
jgi:hypothetical protein